MGSWLHRRCLGCYAPFPRDSSWANDCLVQGVKQPGPLASVQDNSWYDSLPRVLQREQSMARCFLKPYFLLSFSPCPIPLPPLPCKVLLRAAGLTADGKGKGVMRRMKVVRWYFTLPEHRLRAAYIVKHFHKSWHTVPQNKNSCIWNCCIRNYFSKAGEFCQ